MAQRDELVRPPLALPGSGSETIRFEVIAAGPFYAGTTAACNTVTAEVLSVSCQASNVAVGDEVTVWDISGCRFSAPIENLEGAHGLAVKMAYSDIFEVSGCTEEDPEGDCYWQVIDLCCVEEVAGT